jgi:hypothetical protein
VSLARVFLFEFIRTLEPHYCTSLVTLDVELFPRAVHHNDFDRGAFPESEFYMSDYIHVGLYRRLSS